MIRVILLKSHLQKERKGKREGGGGKGREEGEKEGREKNYK